MPNKVLNPEILKSLAKKLQHCPKSDTWLNYQDFKDALIEDEVYISDPSIRNAWIRIKGSEYCGGTTSGKTPTTKKMLIHLEWIRADLGIEVIGENKKKNTDAAGEAY